MAGFYLRIANPSRSLVGWISPIALLSLLMGSVNASAQVLDQANDGVPGGDIIATINELPQGNNLAQTFTVGITGTLTNIEVNFTSKRDPEINRLRLD